MKKMSRTLLVIVIILAVLFVGKNILIKTAVEKGVRVALGVPLKIKQFNVGFVSTNLDIKGLSLYNPKGFPQEVMFHAPEIYVDYKLKSALKGNVHLEEIRLNFDEFVIIKNKDGQLNLDALKPAKKEGEPKKVEEKPQEKREKKAMDIQIDRMSLKIGKVVFKDYSKGGEPVIKESNINFSKEFTDLNNNSIYLAMFGVVPQILVKANLTSLVTFKADDIFAGASDVSKQAVDTLKGAAGSITEKIKLPFGQ